MLLMAQSSAETEHATCWCWDLRAGGKSLSSNSGMSLGVSWSGGTLPRGRLDEEGRRKAMSCSRATTSAL